MYVSYYLHLSNYIDSDHLCYTYLVSNIFWGFRSQPHASDANIRVWSPIDLSPGKYTLSSKSITVQFWAKYWYQTNLGNYNLCLGQIGILLLTMYINGEFQSQEIKWKNDNKFCYLSKLEKYLNCNYFQQKWLVVEVLSSYRMELGF